MSVGVGTPSDTHFNVIVCPIQELAADEEMLSIFAGSVKGKMNIRLHFPLILLVKKT